MKIQVNNQADIANKYIRRLKWKLYNLADKFQHLLYAEIFVKAEGQKPTLYHLKIKLGVPGHDLMLTKKSSKLERLIKELETSAHIHLLNYKMKLGNV